MPWRLARSRSPTPSCDPVRGPVVSGPARRGQSSLGHPDARPAWLPLLVPGKVPDLYFKHTPETLTYELTPPRQLGTDVERVIADVEGHIRREQAQIATNMRAQKRTFAGTKAVLRTSPLDSPDTPRPEGKLTPRLAAGGDAKSLAAAAAALKLFRIAYRRAWKRFKELGDAVFPGGTLRMHKRFGVECEPLDAGCWCELAA